jgi:NADH-quinone oxidoreductase subunit F
VFAEGLRERGHMTALDPSLKPAGGSRDSTGRVDRGTLASIRRDQPEVPPADPAPEEQAAADRVLARYVGFRRDQLLPLLHDVHVETGWFSLELTRYLSQQLGVPFADLYGVITFYALFKTAPAGRTVIRVCKGVPCYLHGAYELGLRLQELLGVGAEEPAGDGGMQWEWFACLGQCERAPAMMVGETAVGNVTPEVLERLAKNQPPESGGPRQSRRAGPRSSGPPPSGEVHSIDPAAQLLLGRCGVVDPTSIEDYEAHGGFAALRQSLEMGPDWVIEQLTKSELTGRGGAAFPTGRKWAAVRAASGSPKYVILNADESEPGTFSNRKLLEEDPFSSVESMIIAGLAVGSSQGYAYIRGEYALAASHLQAAIDSARLHGYLGTNVLGTGQAFEIEIRRGGGAYICGEETSLFASLEGLRGEPRSKPPFPVNVGVFGKPTLINNVETLVNVMPILLMGGDSFAALGDSPASESRDFTGTKLFCLSGHIARPGVYEAPGGITLRELLELGGGVPADRNLQAVLMGGAAGKFVPREHLDTPLTPSALGPLGLTIGPGAVIFFDDTVDMWEVTRLIAEFFAEESCGQCVPCRVGTKRQVEILHRFTMGHGRRDDVQLLQDVGAAMIDASICGLGQTAAWAVLSALEVLPGPDSAGETGRGVQRTPGDP